MAVQEMAEVYMAMDEEPVRQHVLRGEWDEAGGSDLSADERAMLLAAAREELPDVSGFAIGSPPIVVNAQANFDVINHIGGNLTDPCRRGVFSPGNSNGVTSSSTTRAGSRDDHVCGSPGIGPPPPGVSDRSASARREDDLRMRRGGTDPA